MDALTIIVVAFIIIMLWVFRGPLALILGVAFAALIAFGAFIGYCCVGALVSIKRYINHRGRKK